MAYSEEVADRVREELAGERRVTEQAMFGGLCFMVDGNMCCGVTGAELMVRVGPELHHDALTRPHVREMSMGGRSMKGMVCVARAGVEDDTEIEMWVKLGVAYARSLPPKPKKKAPSKKAPSKRAPSKKAPAEKRRSS